MSISEEYKNKIGRKTKKRRKMEKYYDEEYEDFIDCKRHKEEVCWIFYFFFFNFFGGRGGMGIRKNFQNCFKTPRKFLFFFLVGCEDGF